MDRPLDLDEYERWRAEAGRVRHYMPARYPDAHAAGSPGERYGASDSAQALDDARAPLNLVDSAWDDLAR